ncbi:MAG: glycine--tRNA ligase subunit beta [bacterium]|nr:glycine--tRNA ligase subunit beta [bacterium]
MTNKPLSFQEVILKLHQFWSDQGCVIAEPYNVQVGAGTNNPATLLRVLGPEPWRVAYVEPSVRPDDGRFGENPNRMQKYYQYQVILQPDPGNPQELYLQSLEALGINPREHDIRFVEDNWESPGLGAWGLGWEVWLDGQEITQYTYFQQAGGLELNPVAVEITYGVERIVLALQNKEAAWDIDWMEGGLQYRDLFLREEIEHCDYYFNIADVDALKNVFNTYENEHKRALEAGALIPAYDYVLKCNHLFNVLDTRGAIGVTERATYFRRMRDMTRNVARAYSEQRAELGYPLMKLMERWQSPAPQRETILSDRAPVPPPTEPADFLLEIGVEELPSGDVDSALAQLQTAAPSLFESLRLSHEGLELYATPRRLVVIARGVAPIQTDVERIEKGPPANRAFDADGKPTKAAEGFAKGRGVDVAELRVEEIDGGQYVVATVRETGKPAADVLAAALPAFVAGIKFGKTMRWNASNIAFSRPIRWVVALLGGHVLPFEYAGVQSGDITRGLRPYGSPLLAVESADGYLRALEAQGIILDYDERRAKIANDVAALASEVGGRALQDEALLDEVTNLIEAPTALVGNFEVQSLELPRDVLVTVMRDKQRYFAVEDPNGQLMPYFITIRNGDTEHLDKVTYGNEQVLKARFSDARFFYREDIKKPLSEFLPRLSTLTFEVHLGSMLDKNERVAGLIAPIGSLLGISESDTAIAQRAAHLLKADLATQMVVEMTSLQGTMGREYALREGYPPEVANAIFEHWQPRFAGDALPASAAGTLLAVTDRLDSLVGLFAAGLAPKSTADPYGLRRAALGIIQIAVSKGLDVDLAASIDVVADAQPIPVSQEAKAQVLDFIAGRLRVWLGEQGYAPDVVNAVLAEQAANPYRALVGVQQLSAWVQHPDWVPLLDGFARCVRITRAEPERYPVDETLFAQAEESALYGAYVEAITRLDPKANVDGFLTAFAPMIPAVTAFFGTGKGDGVLVHADDPTIRRNRLGLLQSISAMQKGRADLSELMGF